MTARARSAWIEWTAVNTAMWVIIKTSLARLAASDVAPEGQAGLVLTLFGLMLVAQMHVTYRQAPGLQDERVAAVLWLANLIVLAVVFPLSAYGPEQLAWRLGAGNPFAVSLFNLTWALASSALAGVIFVWSLRRSGF